MWGHHLALDCKAGDRAFVTNGDYIRKYARDLVKAIDMVAFGEPQVVHFGSGNKTGYTLVQLIETSNICGHFCDDSGDFYIDVFSCKPFDPDVVVSMTQTYFVPRNIRTHFFDRSA